MQSEIGWVDLGGEALGSLGCPPEEATKTLFRREIASAWREEWRTREGDHDSRSGQRFVLQTRCSFLVSLLISFRLPVLEAAH